MVGVSGGGGNVLHLTWLRRCCEWHFCCVSVRRNASVATATAIWRPSPVALAECAHCVCGLLCFALAVSVNCLCYIVAFSG